MPANLHRFLAGFGGYDELHRWSLDHPREFWPAVWRFCGVKAVRPWSEVLDPGGTRWFTGAGLNFAATVLRPRDPEPALIDPRRHRLWSHRDLYHETARMLKALEAGGVRPGDRVAAQLPAIPEAVIALLATAALGAIWTPVPAGAQQISHLHPTLLFATDLPSLPCLRQLAAGLPSLRQIIVVPLGEPSPSLAGLPRALRWQDSTAFFRGCLELPLAHFPFHHPLVITSPDQHPIAHSAGGALLQFLKELILHFDIQPTSRIRPAGANDPLGWLRSVTALATGAALVFPYAENTQNCTALPPVGAIPGCPSLPNPLAAGAVAPALGIHTRSGQSQPPNPSLPVHWPL